jgi:hypothetical protein
MATPTIGELLSQYPLMMPPGKRPADENPANPRQVAAVFLPPSSPSPGTASTPTSTPTPQPQQDFNTGQGTIGYIPPRAHPTWRGKIGALFQDPDFNNALMVFGANMMRSPQPGQNYGDVLGQSLLQGMGAYKAGKQEKEAARDAKAKEANAAAQQAFQNDIMLQRLGLEREGLEQRREEAKQRASDAELDRQSRENIARMQAAARAAGTGGGTSALEFAFREAKKAFISMGLTEDEAQQRAVRDVIVSQKAPSDTMQAMQRYNQAVDIALQSWMRNPETLLADPTQAAQAIHQLAAQLAQQAQTLNPQFGISPEGTPPLAQPQGSASTSTDQPAPVPTSPRSRGRGGPGQGTRTAPFTEQEAQAAADALRRAIRVWVVNPETGQAEQVTVTPGAR